MKLYFLIFCIFLSGLLTAQKSKSHIKIEVKGLSAGVAKLFSFFGDENFYIDSAFIDVNGRLELKRDTGYHPGYYIVLLQGNIMFQMILDQDQEFNMKSNKSDLISEMIVEGSIDNQLLYESLKLQKSIDQKADSLEAIKRTAAGDLNLVKVVDLQIKELQNGRKNQLVSFQKKYPKSFFTIFKTAGQNPELVDVKKPNGDLDTALQLQYFRNGFWEGVDFNDERLLYTPVIANKLKKFMVDLTVQHPDSIIKQADIVIRKSLVNKEVFKYITNWIGLKYQPTKSKVMGGENVFVHIIQNWFTKENAFWLTHSEFEHMQRQAGEMKASLLYAIGPNVTANDVNGVPRSIYDLTEEFVVVFMYDPDCDHCQEETPELLAIYNEWKTKGLTVFAIVLNSTEKEWLDFIKKNKTESWINVRDPSNVSIYAKYYVDITPEIYLLNKERRIIAKNLQPEQISFFIDKELKERK